MNGKLVRDRIPELFGGQATRLPDAAYVDALRAKLSEETGEYLAAFTAPGRHAELADVLEVLLALAEQDGLTPADLERLRAVKTAERGTFSARLWWNP
ncbi:nucleoside triphosphate pyrophosphohydrolase [Deinococcus radiomollis]|uniref:phosphoribosyl-ATP pyrophosphohydrolase n=1 Tax=Deinococcus radiomollis TaxID=468916 RepID=UPI003892891A